MRKIVKLGAAFLFLSFSFIILRSRAVFSFSSHRESFFLFYAGVALRFWILKRLENLQFLFIFQSPALVDVVFAFFFVFAERIRSCEMGGEKKLSGWWSLAGVLCCFFRETARNSFPFLKGSLALRKRFDERTKARGKRNYVIMRAIEGWLKCNNRGGLGRRQWMVGEGLMSLSFVELRESHARLGSCWVACHHKTLPIRS